MINETCIVSSTNFPTTVGLATSLAPSGASPGVDAGEENCVTKKVVAWIRVVTRPDLEKVVENTGKPGCGGFRL